MTKGNDKHRPWSGKLAAALVITVLTVAGCFLPAVAEADEVVDLQDQSVVYLTGYVKWDGSDPQTRKPIVRLVHVAEDGTAVSLQEGVDYDLELEGSPEDAGYRITITGKNSYGGTLVKEGIFTEGIRESRGSWELLRLTSVSEEDSDFFGIDEDLRSYCYVTKCTRTDAKLKSASLENVQDDLDDYADQHPSWNPMEITRILPGTFEGCEALQEADLYYSDFPAYLFINCPKLKKVTLQNTEAGFRRGEAGPMILGPVDSDRIQILCEDSDFCWWDDSEDDADVWTIRDYCERFGYELIDGSEVVTKGDWTYKVYADDEEAIIVEYHGSAKKVSVPAQFKYNGEVMDVVEILPNAFRDKADLEQINLGELQPVAPLCSNCPKIRKISTLWAEDLEDALENPLVEGDPPVEAGQLRPAGELIFQTFPKLTVDYDDETESSILVEDYCAKYGYLHETFDIRDLSPRIFNNNSRAVILGETATLSVGVQQSALNDSYISLENFAEGYTTGSWKASVAGEAADAVKAKLQQVSGEERLTVTGSLTEPASITISCKVRTPAGDSVTVSTELTLFPRFVPETNTWLTLGAERAVPFAMYVYEDEMDLEEEEEAGEGEPEDPDAYEEDDSYEDIIPDLEVVTVSADAFPEEVIGEYTLDEIGLQLAEIEGSFIRAKEDAKEGQKLTVSAVLQYNQQTYELSVPMEIMDPEALPEELKDLEFQENDVLWVTCLKGSGMPELISTIQGLYPELAEHIEYIEADEGMELGTAGTEAKYRFYQEYLEEEFQTRNGAEASDLIAWPAFMIREQLGSDAAVDLKALGFDSFPGKAYSFTKDETMANEDGADKLYALAYRVDPGGFLYDRAVAKALLGTDDPAEVQKKIGSWQDFVRLGEDLRLGKSEAAPEDCYLLSSAEGLAEAAMPAAGMVSPAWDELDTGDKVSTWLSLERKLAEYDLVAPQGSQGRSLGRFVTAAEFPNPDPSKYGLVRGPSAFAGAAGEYVTATAAHDSEEMNALKSFVLRSIMENERVLQMSQRLGVDRMNNSEQTAGTNAAWDALMRDAEYLPQGQDIISRLVQEQLAGGYTIDQWKKKTGSKKTFGVSLDQLLDAMEKELGETEFPYAGSRMRIMEDGALPEEYQHPGVRMLNRIDLGSGDHWTFDPADPDAPGEGIAAVLTGSDGQLLCCRSLDWAFETLSAQEELDADLRIRLFQDAEGSGLWQTAKPVTLDLNGCRLSAAETAGAEETPEALLSIGSDGEMTIIDESDHQGTIAGSEATAAVKASGGLRIEGGRIEGHILMDPDAVTKLKVTGGSFDRIALEDLLRMIGSREYMQQKGNEDTWAFMADLIVKEAKEQKAFVDTFAKEIANILAAQDANSSLLKEAMAKLTPEQAKAGLTDLALVIYQGQDRDSITPTDAAAALAAVDRSIPVIPSAKIASKVNVKKKNMTLKIPAVKGALNYRLRYRSKAAGAWKYQWTGGKTQTTVSGLARNGVYEVQVTVFEKNSRGQWICGNWSGSIYRYVASTGHKAVKSGKKKVKVTIKKYRNASGYQIIYSPNKKMTKAKVKTVRSSKKTKVTIKRPKKGKPVYVKVRPFKKVAGKIYYGETRKAIKVK
ncbi:MAG: hypothetical protein IJ109_01795 [Firmicutes bacterium]|nr:hypothetical protein [Bacillota bacterium]